MRHIRLLLAALLPTLACVAGAAVGEPSRSCVWIEAENYESQRGSTAAKFMMQSASGGACVDNDWGGQRDHCLRHKAAIRLRRCTAADAHAR